MAEMPIREKLLSVLNARKPMREAQMTNIVCEVAAGFDACKRLGEKANGEWCQTLVNERGLLMWERSGSGSHSRQRLRRLRPT